MSQRVLAACGTDSSDDGYRVPYILDQRPILLHIYMAYAPEGILDVAEICRRVSWLCPRKYHVRLLGGQFLADRGNHYRQVVPGEVIVVEFHPDYLREAFSASHSDSFALDVGEQGGGSDPTSLQHTTEHLGATPDDGGTGGTGPASAPDAAPAATQRLFHSSTVQDRGVSALRTNAAPLVWQQVLWGLAFSIPCRILLLLSIRSNEVTGVHLPHVEPPACLFFEGSADPSEVMRQQGEVPHPEDNSTIRRGRRPVPTPCRNFPGFDLAPGPTEPDPDLCLGSCYTLLEECIADQSCPAFWLAATLLETVIEHFTPQTRDYSPITDDAGEQPSRAICLRLSEHLPSAVSVDLSHVSLPLQQSIDQVLRWTLQGSWTLNAAMPADIRLHPAAKSLLEHCSTGELWNQDFISIFTDGSYGEGTASWAFAVLGFSGGQTSFLGWAAGRVPTDPTDPLFLGQCQQHALCGEQTALFWAAIWAMQGPYDVPIQTFSDCLVALQQAQGIYGWSSTDDLAPLCRSAFQALLVARPACAPQIQHVRSHQGCPANELADSLAKYAGRRPCGCLPRQTWVAKWTRAGTLPWLWVQLEAIRTPDLWPCQVGSSFVDTHRFNSFSPLSEEECYRVLGLPGPDHTEAPSRQIQVSLRLLSVNVQSLTDPTVTSEGSDADQGFRGRARYLREQLAHLKVHVSALQEARSREDATFVSDSHIRYCTAKDPAGNFGCELWFSRLLPFVWQGQNFGCFHPNDFLAISAIPRDLIVRFSRSGLKLLFVCVHAPVAGHKERDLWWQDLRNRLGKLRRDAEIVLLGDFNMGFPSPIPHRVGNLVWPTLHPPAKDFFSILREHDLWLPSTFSGCHIGPHETWQSPTGNSGSRLDYVAVPSAWQVPPSGSWVDFTLDWGQPRVDHFGICLDVFFHARVGKQSKQRSSNLDREAMASAEGQQALLHICSTIPLQPWATDVHRHYLAIEQYLSQALAVSFPSRRGVCRSSHFSASTWELRQKRVWLRKQVAWERTHTSLTEAQAALFSWRHGLRLAAGRVGALFPRIVSIRRLQGLVGDMQEAKRGLRQSIRRDISLRIQTTAAAAAALPCADVVARLRPLLGPSKRRVKQRKALLPVCHPDGRPAQSASEVEDIWIGHFGSIEDGARVDPVSFVRGIQQQQNSRDLECYSLDASTVPTRLELEQALRQTQTGRAVGLDHVPGELLHFAASSASRALFQLFMKTALRASEPVQFKGGALHAVWKGKSSPAFCSSHRGILVSSNVGKAFHRIARARAVPALRNVATDMQIGGLPTFPVVLASHFVRLFQSGARDRQRSHGLLFLDLREAFYRVVRPLLVGSSCSDEQIAAAVKAVQLPTGVMHELHEHLQQSSAAREAGASDWTDLAITDALTGTWFRFQSGHQVVQTGIGSRPGDNLADICFSFIFAKVLRSVQETLNQHGLTPTLPWNPAMTGNVFPVAVDEGCTIPALDATWMDDATFLVGSPTSHALPVALASTGAAVIDACVGRALLPNLDKGKTEFIACPLGQGSRQVRKDLFTDSDPSLRLDSRLWPDSRVRLVSSYRHLGGIIHHDSSLSRELKHRVALAWKAFNTRKRQIFGSPGVCRKDKVVLFESLVLSVLLYGAGSWDLLSAREENILTTAYHSMCFYMLRPAFSYEEALHLGGPRVLALLELPTIPTLLHVARLRHLLSVVRTAVPVMWGMLHWQGGWLSSVRSSLSWLWSCVDGGSQYQSWELAWAHWRTVCHNRPKQWKGWIRKAQAQATLQETWLSAESQHLGLLVRQLRQAGAILPAPPQPSGPVRQCCAPCQKTFATYQAWSMHAFKCHGIVGEYRHVLSGKQCQACLRHFTTHIKLCRHLQHFPSCRRSLQSRGFRCIPEPGIGSRKAVDEGNFQAPSLQAQGP